MLAALYTPKKKVRGVGGGANVSGVFLRCVISICQWMLYPAKQGGTLKEVGASKVFEGCLLGAMRPL